MDQQQPQRDLFSSDLKIDEIARRHISGLAQWAMIVVVTSVIGYAISLLRLFSGRTPVRDTSESEGFETYIQMGTESTGGSLFTIVIGLIANLFLYRFVIQARKSLAATSHTDLAGGFRNLRIYFVIITVIMIIVVLLGIILTLAFA